MSVLGEKIIDALLDFREFAGGFLEPILPLVKVLGAALIALFVYGIIYAGMRSRWFATRADEWTDALVLGSIGRRRTLRAWRGILKGLHTTDAKEWRSAVIEADRIFGEILRVSGFRGDSVHERLSQVTPEVFPNVEEWRQAHAVRERLEKEPHFELRHTEAIQIIRVYARAFREFGLID